ncbi:MAG: hypothetical protein ACKPKO_05225, partial [Candidatus Fonsibacter sp.]
ISFGKCTKTNCPYDHHSPNQMDQIKIKRALGKGNGGDREKSRDSTGSKGSNRGRGRDRGRGKGKGKRENKGKSAGAKADGSPDPDGRKWCLAHMKGTCNKGDAPILTMTRVTNPTEVDRHPEMEKELVRESSDTNGNVVLMYV